MSSTPDQARRSNDRIFKVTAAVAAVALVGFIIYVVAKPRTAKPASFPETPPSSLERGAAAPAFALPRLGGGAPVTLAAAPGTPTVVNFFASWCSNCRAELKAFATVAGRNSATVNVVGVDSNDTSTSNAEALLAAAHASYPVGVDANAQVASDYKLEVLPVTYFVTAKGTVAGVAFGTQSVASLTRLEHTLLGVGSGH